MHGTPHHRSSGYFTYRLVDPVPFGNAFGLYVGGVEDTEDPKLEVDQQDKGQAIGERLLTAIGEGVGSGHGIDARPVIGRRLVASDVLADLNRHAFEVQGYARGRFGSAVGGRGFARHSSRSRRTWPLLLRLGQIVTAQDMAHRVRGEGKPLLLLEAMGRANGSEVCLLPLLEHQALHIAGAAELSGRLGDSAAEVVIDIEEHLAGRALIDSDKLGAGKATMVSPHQPAGRDSQERP